MTRVPVSALLLPTIIAGCYTARLPDARLDIPALAIEPLGWTPLDVLPPMPSHRPAPIPSEIARALEARVVELQRRGGACAAYAAVMAYSYRRGSIAVRPYMWRVDGRLVSGSAAPDGSIQIAREIDPLNPGVRTIDDVLWSVEHEAAHLAFRIPNDELSGQDPADRYVRACRSPRPWS